MIRRSMARPIHEQSRIHDLEALALAVGILALVFALCLLTAILPEAF